MNRIDNSGAGIARLGRDEDKYMAHVAAGEMVVPPVITAETRARLFQEMQQVGLDPSEYTVGEGMSINPITGLPEFGFFKKIIKQAGPIIGAAAGFAVGGPAGAAAGAGLGTKTSAMPSEDILRNAALAFGGTGGLGSLGTGAPGTNPIGNIFSNPIGSLQNVGSSIGNFFTGGAGGSQYTIQSGDTLSQIAAKSGTTVDALAKANGIANPNMIFAGQNLTIPGSGGGGLGGLFGNIGSSLGNIFGGGMGGAQDGSNPLANLLGSATGAQAQGGGGILDTVLKGIVAKKLLDQKSPNPADIVPLGINAFGYTPEMTEALKNKDYSIGNLRPALIEGQNYANLTSQGAVSDAVNPIRTAGNAAGLPTLTGSGQGGSSIMDISPVSEPERVGEPVPYPERFGGPVSPVFEPERLVNGDDLIVPMLPAIATPTPEELNKTPFNFDDPNAPNYTPLPDLTGMIPNIGGTAGYRTFEMGGMIPNYEMGGILGLESGMMVNPNRMDNNGPGDITPAFLEPGEFVMTRPATQVLGARNLYKLMKQAEQMT